MSFKFFPSTDTDIKEMLDTLGLSSLDELYDDVPSELKLRKNLELPTSKSELEIRDIFSKLERKNKT